MQRRHLRQVMAHRITPEFVHEYEEELRELFRRRLTWYLAVMISLITLFGLMIVGLTWAAGSQSTQSLSRLLLGLLLTSVPTITVYSSGLILARRCGTSKCDLLATAWWIIQISALLTFASAYACRFLMLAPTSEPGIMEILLTHTMACLFLPWTVRQCLYAFAPQLWIWAMSTGLMGGGLSAILPAVFFAPMVGIPGVVICAWRMSSFERQFDHRMVRRAFSTIKRELIDARKLHESLFPDPVTSGSVGLWYSYQPMRQLGGDYLHIHTDDQGCLQLVLIDVTGHGIAAALTVNRLAGEIERLHAEGLATADLNQDGQLDPDELLTALNRYIWFTLSKHSVFATAFIARIEPPTEDRAGTITWASGGHPPAVLRRHDGTIDLLDSTTYLLGAIPPGAFHAEQGVVPMEDGDCIIAYTDGAFESRDRFGDQFGLDRLRDVIKSSPRTEAECVRFIRQAVDTFRYGPNDDDILIVAARLRPEEAAMEDSLMEDEPRSEARAAVTTSLMPAGVSRD
jgi:serine phosphatase RsbU (regulator of sigma subunit)